MEEESQYTGGKIGNEKQGLTVVSNYLNSDHIRWCRYQIHGAMVVRSLMTSSSICLLGGFTIFQKFEFDLVQLIHGAYHISKHGEGN